MHGMPDPGCVHLVPEVLGMQVLRAADHATRRVSETVTHWLVTCPVGRLGGCPLRRSAKRSRTGGAPGRGGRVMTLPAEQED